MSVNGEVPETRPILLSAQERRRLDGLAAMLERRNFRPDAELVRGLAARYDGSTGLLLIQETPLTRAVANGDLVAPRRRRRATPRKKATAKK